MTATSADLGSYRQVAKEAVLTIGAHPIEETNFPTDYRELEALLARRLDPCRQFLETLQQDLTAGTALVVAQPIGVYADGGVGKTALAAEVGYSA